jgi:phosphate transport system substrate-binding protein
LFAFRSERAGVRTAVVVDDFMQAPLCPCLLFTFDRLNQRCHRGFPGAWTSRRHILRKLSRLAAVGALALGLVAGLAAPGGAIPAGNGINENLNAVGSDTTFFVMRALAPMWNADTTINQAAHPDKVWNTPPRLGGAFPTSYDVPADSKCGAQNYPPLVTPDGSSAGISALIADGTKGCVDFARSSRGRKSTDPSSLKFWAYGLDGLTWVRWSGGHQPTNLTQQQLINIYTCNPSTGAPYATNWSQVGGTAGPIVKYAPQTSSGTYSFFNSKILNGAVIDQNCNSTHLSHFVEEHDNTTIPAGQKPYAINAFSFGQWTAMANGVIPNRRNGALLGSINGTAPSLTTIRVVNPHFLGTRYIYNVLKTGEASYNATLRFAGVDATGPGWLCRSSADIRAKIRQFGDVPLTSGVSGPGLPASFCRLEPTPL